MAALINSTDKELPSNLTELYSKFIELMLGRWEIEKGLLNTMEFEASIAICCDIAKYFFDNNLSYISIDEALGFFDGYLSSRHLSIDSLSLFDKVSKRSGILIQDSERNRICFRHRTFIEFMYALGEFRKGARIVVDDQLFNPSKHIVYFFKFGLQKDAATELDEVVKISLNDDLMRFTKFHYLPKYCLAAYLTPYETIKNAIRNSLSEAADLYVQTCAGKTRNPLQDFPAIPLLYTFQYSVRSAYSYEFFKRALLEIENDITANKQAVNNEHKAALLFFVAVTKADLKCDKPFDALVKSFSGEDIPFLVSLGIHYEAHRTKEATTILNRHEKRVRKLIQGSGSGMKDFLEKLHSEPIRSALNLSKAE